MLRDVGALLDHVAVAPAADRRLSRRLIDAWARAARGHFPSWAAMQEMNLGDDWDWPILESADRSCAALCELYRFQRGIDEWDAELSTLCGCATCEPA